MIYFMVMKKGRRQADQWGGGAYRQLGIDGRDFVGLQRLECMNTLEKKKKTNHFW